jgi:hypothetical protein
MERLGGDVTNKQRKERAELDRLYGGIELPDRRVRSVEISGLVTPKKSWSEAAKKDDAPGLRDCSLEAKLVVIVEYPSHLMPPAQWKTVAVAIGTLLQVDMAKVLDAADQKLAEAVNAEGK